MNLDKPVKPKHYKLRLYTPLCVVPIFIIAWHYRDHTEWQVLIACVFFGATLLVRLKLDPKEVADYYNYEQKCTAAEFQKGAKNPSVNDNILKYKEMQRIRKLNASWWEFWV